MKALGGREWQMSGLFLLETLVLALSGVAAGYILGSGAAWVISETNFHTATLPRISVIPLGAAAECRDCAAGGSAAGEGCCAGLRPAALLKGE